MKKENKMAETKVEEAVKTLSLAFRVRAHGENLFSAEMLLLEGNEVIDSRHGAGTTLGHAIAATDNLVDGWAFNEVETRPEEYFKAVML